MSNLNRESEIAQRLEAVRAELGPNVELIVVTKTFPLSDVQILYKLGQRHFGENRDSEGAEKSTQIADDAIWHFQGGIQSNKLKSIVAWSDYIHSPDDLTHAAKISQLASKLGKVQKCFIQINLDQVNLDQINLDSPMAQGQRSGIAPENLVYFISQVKGLAALEIVGVMGVGPLSSDPAAGFEQLRVCSQQLQNEIPGARFISAGMSGDYQVALRFGATHVRLGSSILGTR